MANSITMTSLVDGENVGVMHIAIVADTAAEYTDEVVLDASALAGAFAIDQIISVESNLVGFHAYLEFDQTTDALAVVIPDGNGSQSFVHTPIKNPKGSGTTGDVVLTTIGLGTGDVGVIIVKYRK